MGFFSYGLKGLGQLAWDKGTIIPKAAWWAAKKVTPGTGKFHFNPAESRSYGQIIREGTKEHLLRAKVKAVRGAETAVKLPGKIVKGVGKAGLATAAVAAAPFAAIGGAYRFTKQTSNAIRNGSRPVQAAAALGISGGAYWGSSAMQEYIDKRNAERAAETGGYYGKTASESVDGLDIADKTPANIPVDTSTPSSNQPFDGVDYFDYQEWANSDQPYPDRGESETTKYVSAQKPAWDTRKVASILDMDASVVLSFEDYSTGRERLKTAKIADKLFSNMADSVLDIAARKGRVVPKLSDDYIRNTPIKNIAGEYVKDLYNKAHMGYSGAKLLGGALATSVAASAPAAKSLWKNKGYIPYAYLAAPDSVKNMFKSKPKSNTADTLKLVAGIAGTTAAASAAATYYSEGNHQWNPYYMSR